MNSKNLSKESKNLSAFYFWKEFVYFITIRAKNINVLRISIENGHCQIRKWQTTQHDESKLLPKWIWVIYFMKNCIMMKIDSENLGLFQFYKYLTIWMRFRDLFS